MSIKKQLLIFTSAVAVVIIIGAITVMGLQAILNAKLGATSNTTYASVNVDAIIAGSYKRSGQEYTSLKSGEESFLAFSANNKNITNKSFDAIEDIVIKSTEKLTFRYEITNLSTTEPFYVSLGEQAEVVNITVNYFCAVKSQGGEKQANAVFGERQESEIKIEANQTICLYVELFVTDADEDASFNGPINFLLTAI